MDSRRQTAIKMAYWAFFQLEIQDDRFTNLHKLYDAAHITNDLLERQLNKHAAVMTDLHHAVFNDIAYLIIDSLAKNSELVSYFDELYYYPYKDLYDSTREAVECCNSGNYDKAFRVIQKQVRKVINYSEQKDYDRAYINAIQKTSNYRMMKLLLLRYPELDFAGVITEDSISEDVKNWNLREGGTSEYSLNDAEMVFTDDGELIYKTKLFDKFIRRQKEALATYLGITVDELPEYFYKNLEFDVRAEDLTYLTQPGEPGVVNMGMLHVIQRNYGGSQWLQTITTSKKIRKGSLEYRPDFDSIAESYYKARVFVKYTSNINAQLGFTKLDLSRECKAESPRDDYLSLMYLYNIDIVYQMFKLMQQMYYRDFSWESIAHQNVINRSNQIIRELREVIADKDIVIANLNRRLQLANEASQKELDAKRIVELKSYNKLADDICEKEKEIETLKRRIKYQDELLEAINREDRQTDDIVIDKARLQMKRYLFVGHTEDVFPELYHALKRDFPNSIYMLSETDSIDQIQVDAIILFVNWTSHGMYYKVRANNSLSEIPVVYCKSKNIEKIYQEIQLALQ